MSIHSSIKCTREESTAFRDKVWDFLEKENLPYSHLRALRAYNGNVRVYTGRKVEHTPLRRSRKVIVFKNAKGEWEGDKDYLEDKEWMAMYAKGDAVFLKDYHSRMEEQYLLVYREDDWNDEKRELRAWLIKQEEVRKIREKEKL